MATRRPLVLVGGELKELPAGDTMLSALLGATTVGDGLLKLPNPGALSFPRFNADNTISALAAADFRSAIGAGTSSFNGAYASLTGIPSTFTPAAHNQAATTITADATHRFVTDTEKSTWDGKVSFPGFGTTGTTAAVGNDSRLSDARTPLAHNQAWSTITSTPTTLAGYAISDAQPLDSDLTSIAALTTTTFGRSLLTQADAAATRSAIGAGTSSFDGAYASLTGIPSTFTPAAHNQAWSTITATPTTLSGYGITDAQGLDSDLTAIAGNATNGLWARTGAGTGSARTITGSANQVTVTNGDGVAGNPTLALPQNIATTSTPTFSGVSLDGNLTLTGTGKKIIADCSSSTLTNRLAFQTSVTNRGTFVFSYPNGTGVGSGYTCFNSSDIENSGALDLYLGGSSATLNTARTGTGLLPDIAFSINNSAALTISTARAIRFNSYGAGTLVTDSSGNVTASSDRRLKNVSGKFTRGLDAIMEIQPKVFTWKPESGMNPDDVNVGFIAQDVQGAIPEAVGSMKTRDAEEDDGTGKKVKKSKREASEFLTLSDRPIIAALVNAVKELKAENDALSDRLSKLEGKK